MGQKIDKLLEYGFDLIQVKYLVHNGKVRTVHGTYTLEVDGLYLDGKFKMTV